MNNVNCYTPVVLWHGMGDSCCFSFSLGAIKKLIEEKLPTVYVYSIRMDNNVVETYKNNLQKLHTMVLVRFNNDTIVTPWETEWFRFYMPGQAKQIQTLEQINLYREDRLGLKVLYDSGKIYFLSVPGNHLQFTKKWFINKVINMYLS